MTDEPRLSEEELAAFEAPHDPGVIAARLARKLARADCLDEGEVAAATAILTPYVEANLSTDRRLSAEVRRLRGLGDDLRDACSAAAGNLDDETRAKNAKGMCEDAIAAWEKP